MGGNIHASYIRLAAGRSGTSSGRVRSTIRNGQTQNEENTGVADSGHRITGYNKSTRDLSSVRVESNVNRVNMDDEYDSFVSTLKNIQEEFIPTKEFRSYKNDPKWMNNRIKHLIGIIKGVYKRIKRGEEHLRQQYSEINRKVKKSIREAKRNYEIKVARESRKNPKGFFQLYQSKVKEKVGPIEMAEGHTTDDDKEMCSSLNEYFLSVFTSENLECIPEVEAVYTGSPENKLSKTDIRRENIIKEIDKLKAHKSPGPDEIYARVLM